MEHSRFDGRTCPCSSSFRTLEFLESSCWWGMDIRRPGPHPNFRRLVLGCIDADLCNQRLILKSSPRSTKYTLSWISQISKFHLKFSIFPVIFSGFWFKIAFFIEKCIFLFEKVHFQYIFAKENALFKPWMCPPAATGLPQLESQISEITAARWHRPAPQVLRGFQYAPGHAWRGPLTPQIGKSGISPKLFHLFW